MADAKNPDLEWALAEYAAQAKVYRKRRRYWEGDFDIPMSSETYETYFADMLRDQGENLCAVVVDELVDRQEIVGWEGSDADTAEEWWKRHGMRTWSNRVHSEAAALGDHYVMVWPDGRGENRAWTERAENIAVAYDLDNDLPDTIRFVARRWLSRDAKTTYLNLYYADRVERFEGAATSSQFGPRRDNDGPVVTNPFGEVPFVHFGPGADMGGLGVSDLRDVIAPQDRLNKAVMDLAVIMESHALPMRLLMGVEPFIDPVTGAVQHMDFDPFVDKFLTFAGTDAKAVQFDAADLRQIIEVIASAVVSVSRVSRVPLHRLIASSGQMPSGEALRVAEAPINKKADDRNAEFTPKWTHVLRLAGVDAEPVWADPQTVSDKEKAETAILMQDAGFSRRRALQATFGVTDEEFDAMEAEAEGHAARAAQAAMDAFRRGQEDPFAEAT